MNFSDYLFYFVSAIVLISAGSAVFSVKVETALKSILISLSSLTMIYFYLSADYIAIIHLTIFVTGTCGVLLFAFVKSGEFNNNFESSGSIIALIISAVFTSLLLGTLVSNKWKEVPPDKPGLSAGEITGLISSQYFLPLMIMAIILFIGILGASYYTRKH